MIGNAIEWYEFTIYGYLGTTLGILFFPQESYFAQTLSSFSIFAVGFIARPLGGIVLGLIGDRFGRRISLLISMYIIALATIGIAILPTYSYFGIKAAYLLILLRLLQGFALGGEHSGSMVFLVEHAPLSHKGRYGSLAASSLAIGMIIGNCVVLILEKTLTQTEILSWGWRIPFALGTVGIFWALLARVRLTETNEYKLFSKSYEHKHIKINKKYMYIIACSIGINSFLAFEFYKVTIFFSSYVKDNFLSINSHFLLSTIVVICLLASILISGWITDKFSEDCSIKYIPIISIFISAFFLIFLDSQSEYSVFFSFILISVLVGLYFGNMPSFLGKIFPVGIRLTSIAITNNFSMAFFGGTAPMILFLIINYCNFIYTVSISLMFFSIVSIFSYFLFNKIQIHQQT